MQYSRGLRSPAAWRAALRLQPSDISTRLGLAQALIAYSMEAAADGGDEDALLGECAETLAAIGKVDELSGCDTLLYASTAGRCAGALTDLGRPRLALGVLTPALHALESWADRASIVGCPCKFDAEPTFKTQGVTGHAPRPEFQPVNWEDTAPGELFERPWPLPAVSWHYLRAALGIARGQALVAIGSVGPAMEELSEAALIALEGAPFDYTRTADLSVLIGGELERLVTLAQSELD